MNWIDYQEAAKAFVRYSDPPRHSLMGVTAEWGELVGELLRPSYGKTSSLDKIALELGDVFWNLSIFLQVTNSSIDMLIPSTSYAPPAIFHLDNFLLETTRTWGNVLLSACDLVNFGSFTGPNYLPDLQAFVRRLVALCAYLGLDTHYILEKNIEKLTKRYAER